MHKILIFHIKEFNISPKNKKYVTLDGHHKVNNRVRNGEHF